MSKQDNPPDSDVIKASGPWMPTQSPLKDVIKDYQGYYGDPWSYQNYTYGPSTVAPMNALQLAGIYGGAGQALAGAPGMQQGMDVMTGIMGQNWRDSPGSGFMSSVMGGSYDTPLWDEYSDTLNSALNSPATDTGINTLRKFASGDYVGRNPYANAMYDVAAGRMGKNFQESVNPTIEGMIARSGAGGGGSIEQLLKGQAQGELAREMGDFGTNFYGSLYSGDMDRMMGAAGALPGAVGTQIGTQLNALNAQQNAYQQDLANRMGSAEYLGGLNQQGINNSMNAATAMPGMWQASMQPFNMLTGMGGMLQQQQERELAEQRGEFEFNRDRYPSWLGQQTAAYGGVGGLGSPGAAAAAMQPQATGFGNFLGTAMGLGGLGAQFYGLSQGNPYARGPGYGGMGWGA